MAAVFLANQIPHNFTLTHPLPPLPAANLVHRYLIWDLRLFAMNCLDVALGYGFFFVHLQQFFSFLYFVVFFNHFTRIHIDYNTDVVSRWINGRPKFGWGGGNFSRGAFC